MAAQRIRGFCALCRSRCGCISVVEDGKLVAVEPDPDHPTGAAICVKGRSAPELVYSDDRLLFPLRRTRPKGDPDPGWERISWEEALEWTASELGRLADTLGPESVAFASASPSASAVSDSLGWIERLIQLFGSPNLLSSSELCGWHKDFGSAYTFGVGLPAPDFRRAGCILLWGHNPAATWLAHATHVSEGRRNGAALVVVDPRRVGLARQADEWVRIRPGTDGALALGIANVMIERGWFDRDFVREWTTGSFLVRDDNARFLRPRDLLLTGPEDGYVSWDATAGAAVVYSSVTARHERPLGRPALFGTIECPSPGGTLLCRPAFEQYAALCREYPAERVEELTGVPARQVVEVARLLYEHRPVAYYYWTGIGQHTNAAQTERALSLLYALTGSFDAPGGNVLFSRPRTNRISGVDLFRSAQLERAADREQRPLGPARQGWLPSHSFARAVLEGDPYPIRGMLAFGTNLLLSQPDAGLVRRALTELDFLAVCDMFLTPTAELADLVLPVSSAWEREGLRAGFEVTQEAEQLVQLRPQIVPPRGEARSDTEIVFELAQRLGLGDRFFGGDIDAGYSFVLEPSGVTLPQLRAAPGGVRVPLTTRHRKYAESPGGRSAGFSTPSARVEIYLEEFLDHGQNPLPDYVAHTTTPAPGAGDYPLLLTSAKTLHAVHGQHRNLPKLRRPNPYPILELSRESAAARGLVDGDWIVIETPLGSMQARARLNGDLAAEVVCAEFGWWQACRTLGLPAYPALGPASANFNALIGSDAVDPISGSTPLRAYRCDVRKAGEPDAFDDVA